MQIPPLTQSVGSAERAMRALLEQIIGKEGLSFPAWTTLVFTHASPLTAEQIAQRQIGGHVVSGTAEARQAIDALSSNGLIVVGEQHMFSHTEKGAALFKKISDKVKEITGGLYGDLPVADLEATHRTLLEVARRANGLLAAATS